VSDPGGPVVVLVRHGETEWSRSGQHTGRTDIPLTPLGREQATRLGERLKGQRFSLVLTSPLARAADTCRLAGFGDQAEATDDLLEWDYGDYEGRRTVDIHAERPGWLLWRDGVPGGERLGNVCARADRVADRAHAASGPVLLFGHGHQLRVLATSWLGLHPQRAGQLALSPASISVLGSEHGNPAILRWNDTAHLDHLPAPVPDPAPGRTP
jgi:broad specificity phosphatase PhoE